MPKEVYSRNDFIAIAFLFAISYALLYLLSLSGDAMKNIPFLDLVFPLNGWDSPTFFLVPIAGFFLVFYVIEWIKHYFESGISYSPVFPAAFIILCLLAFYASLFFYFYPSYQKAQVAICMSSESGCTNLQQSLVQKYQPQGIPVMVVKFWPEFKGTSFGYFMLAGVLAWLSHFVFRKLKEKRFI